VCLPSLPLKVFPPAGFLHHGLEEHDVRPLDQVSHHALIVDIRDFVVDQSLGEAQLSHLGCFPLAVNEVLGM